MTDEEFTFKLLKGFTYNDISTLYNRGYLINKQIDPQFGITIYTVDKPFIFTPTNHNYKIGETFLD